MVITPFVDAETGGESVGELRRGGLHRGCKRSFVKAGS